MNYFPHTAAAGSMPHGLPVSTTPMPAPNAGLAAPAQIPPQIVQIVEHRM